MASLSPLKVLRKAVKDIAGISGQPSKTANGESRVSDQSSELVIRAKDRYSKWEDSLSTSSFSPSHTRIGRERVEVDLTLTSDEEDIFVRRKERKLSREDDTSLRRKHVRLSSLSKDQKHSLEKISSTASTPTSRTSKRLPGSLETSPQALALVRSSSTAVVPTTRVSERPSRARKPSYQELVQSKASLKGPTPAVSRIQHHAGVNSLGAPKVHLSVQITAKGSVRTVAQTEYAERLCRIPGPPVTLHNSIDDSTPSTNFTFIYQYRFSPGIKRVDEDFQSGCTCHEGIDRTAGCESVDCDCLEDGGRDRKGRSLGFPYYATGPKRGRLREVFLHSREPIYECNDLCNCSENCRTRVVQKGRKVRLEIFKTWTRGFGLRSPDPISRGQFIDIYLGEVIADAEAVRREKTATKGKDSYLFSLDKFQGIEGELDYIPTEELYVVDGEFMGGPTRFMNHSCMPNCRQFAVVMTRGDVKVYELAFFALEDIPAGTELTFDYLDKDHDNDDDKDRVTDDNVRTMEKQKDKLATKCLCSSSNCRKYLWL